MATRSLSAVIGTLVVWLSYRVGLRLLDAGSGLFSAVLMALLPPHIYYSQISRMYELLVLCALFSIWAFAEFSVRPRLVSALAYVLSTLAMLYTQTAGIFFVIAQNIFFRAHGFQNKPGAKLAPPLSFLVHRADCRADPVPAMAPVTGGQVERLRGTFWVARESIFRYLGGTFLIFSGSTRYPATYLIALLLILLIVVALPRVATWWFARPGHETDGFPNAAWGFGLAAAIALLPGLGMTAMSQVFQPIFVPRAVLPSAVAVYWLAGAGLSRLSVGWRASVMGLAILAATTATIQYCRIDRTDYREDVRLLLTTVARLLGPGDLMFLEGWPVTGKYLHDAAKISGLDLHLLPRVVTIAAGELPAAIRAWCPARASHRFVVVPVEPLPLPVPISGTIPE